MHNVVKEVESKLEQIHRLIPSQFPPINLFEVVSDPANLDYVYAIEALTNDRIKQEVGDLSLVPLDERISGPGTTPIMAAFTHINAKVPTRFTDNTSYGVYYGASDLETAFAETIYHREKFLSSTNESDTDITMRDYINKVIRPLHDITDDVFSGLYEQDYFESQLFSKRLKEKGSNGLLYKSVRNYSGFCVAIFKPKALSIPIQGSHYLYKYCGKSQTIVNVIKMELLR